MPGGPRRLPSGTITFVFTDIEGSTRLVEELGPGWADVLSKHRQMLRRAFRRHDGIEMGTEGDSFFVVFPLAPAAVAAVVEAQRGLASARWPADGEVRVRIGLHSGQARVVGSDYVGIDVHRAARIGAAAHGGQIVISESTMALVERDLPAGVEVQDLGRHWLKDLPAQEHLYQLVVPGLPSEFPPLRTTDRIAGNLPVALTTFVGRGREVDAVSDLLRTSRLVTLVGPAGTGKTRLVIESAGRVAPEFRDGVWFVGLESVADPSQVPAAVAAAVKVREVGGKPAAAVLVDHLRTRQCLLVLDNFEHLLDAGPFVTDLLAAAPNLSIITTSQVELQLSGEQLYPVAPLDIRGAIDSDAARLFIDRARSAVPDFVVTPENAAAIAEICARLDGLPLAIELAAARVRGLGINEVTRRLDRRLSLLSTGPRDAPDRHRTLRAALAWSHELLGQDEAVLFRSLGVFSGGASLAAIERICAGDPSGEQRTAVSDPIATLDELVRHSLVRADVTPVAIRYLLLETIREFASERLDESGEAPAIHRRHAEWCAEFLESIAPRARLRPGEVRAAAPEVDNILSALEWAAEAGEVDLGLRICGSAWRVWERGQRLRDGLAWTQRFLALEQPEADASHRIRSLEAAGAIAYWLGDGTAAVNAYRDRLALAERHGPANEVADARLDLYFGLSVVGQMAAARDELARAHSSFEAIQDRLGVARCRWAESSLLLMDHRASESCDGLREVLVVFRDHGDVNYEGLTMGSLAICSLAMGDLVGADRWFRQALSLAESTSTVGAITGLGAWSQLLGRIGYPQLAARLQGAYEALSETYGITMARGLREVIDLLLRESVPMEQLPEEERRHLFEEGRRLTLDDVLAVVRDLAGGHEDQPAPVR
jgi:predicted ATPase/class 3 adenylate cyclase